MKKYLLVISFMILVTITTTANANSALEERIWKSPATSYDTRYAISNFIMADQIIRNQTGYSQTYAITSFKANQYPAKFKHQTLIQLVDIRDAEDRAYGSLIACRIVDADNNEYAQSLFEASTPYIGATHSQVINWEYTIPRPGVYWMNITAFGKGWLGYYPVVFK